MESGLEVEREDRNEEEKHEHLEGMKEGEKCSEVIEI